jgi:carbon monoxide dehydrogenase subunit G
MTQVISDLTVSVERTVGVDGDAVFDVLADPETLGTTDRVARDSTATAARGPPPRLRPGDTYVGDVLLRVEDDGRRGSRDADVGGSEVSFESYFTVEHSDSGRLVLSGGGDADVGSYDARITVAVADVPEGAVLRVDATMDVAGSIAGVGAESVRASVVTVLDRYLSGVERAAP